MAVSSLTSGPCLGGINADMMTMLTFILGSPDTQVEPWIGLPYVPENWDCPSFQSLYSHTGKFDGSYPGCVEENYGNTRRNFCLDCYLDQLLEERPAIWELKTLP